MKSREEFIKRWRAHTAGLLALNGAKVRRLMTGPIESAGAFGQVILDLEETTTILLGQLYDDLSQEPLPVSATKPTSVPNGTHAHAKKDNRP